MQYGFSLNKEKEEEMVNSILSALPQTKAETIIKWYMKREKGCEVYTDEDVTLGDLTRIEFELREICSRTMDLLEEKGTGNVLALDEFELWDAVGEYLTNIYGVLRAGAGIFQCKVDSIMKAYDYCVTHCDNDSFYCIREKKDTYKFWEACGDAFGCDMFIFDDCDVFDVYSTKGAFAENVGMSYEDAKKEGVAATVDGLYVFLKKNRYEAEVNYCK